MNTAHSDYSQRFRNLFKETRIAFAIGVLSLIIAIIFPIQLNTNNLVFQQDCATQAEKAVSIFETENDFTLGFGSSEQNHYNTESNRCFVLIDHSGYTTKSTANDATEYGDLLDAYENNDIANCAFYGNKNPSTQICWIGGQNVTYQEYEDFVNQKMGLGTYDPLGEATSTN